MMDPGVIQGSNAIEAGFGVRSCGRNQFVLHCLEGCSSSWVESLMIQVVAASSQLCSFQYLLTRLLGVSSLFLEVVLVVVLRRAVSSIKSGYLAAYLLNRLWL